jgi:hypothetical protein
MYHDFTAIHHRHDEWIFDDCCIASEKLYSWRVLMDENLTVEVIKQLPLAAVAIIACIALWRKVNARTDEHIKDLREEKQNDINDLRARVMAVEDHLHISRSERMKYIPSVTMPKGVEIKDLD